MATFWTSSSRRGKAEGQYACTDRVSAQVGPRPDAAGGRVGARADVIDAVAAMVGDAEGGEGGSGDAFGVAVGEGVTVDVDDGVVVRVAVSVRVAVAVAGVGVTVGGAPTAQYGSKLLPWLVSCVIAPVATSMTKICSSRSLPSREAANAILVPSGDQVGL